MDGTMSGRFEAKIAVILRRDRLVDRGLDRDAPEADCVSLAVHSEVDAGAVHVEGAIGVRGDLVDASVCRLDSRRGTAQNSGEAGVADEALDRTVLVEVEGARRWPREVAVTAKPHSSERNSSGSVTVPSQRMSSTRSGLAAPAVEDPMSKVAITAATAHAEANRLIPAPPHPPQGDTCPP
jgi:hypothetical protein